LRALPVFFNFRNKSPKGLGLTLDGLLQSGFILLAENPNEELVLGLVGRFWTPSGEIQQLDVKEFLNFDKPGYAKAVWNFFVSRRSDDSTLLSTETRVYCLEANSRRRFRVYWKLVKPFSDEVRKEALRLIKTNAEKEYLSNDVGAKYQKTNIMNDQLR